MTVISCVRWKSIHLSNTSLVKLIVISRYFVKNKNFENLLISAVDDLSASGSPGQLRVYQLIG